MTPLHPVAAHARHTVWHVVNFADGDWLMHCVTCQVNFIITRGEDDD